MNDKKYKLVCYDCAKKLKMEAEYSNATLRALPIDGEPGCMMCGKHRCLAEIRIKMTKKKVKKVITIDMFQSCIPWEQIEYTMGKRQYKQFQKWMKGQTCPIGGVYKHDLDRFLKGLPVID